MNADGPDSYERAQKHSLTLKGHRTSVSLEREFWDGFRKIAKGKGVSANELAAHIDAQRGLECGLASAIRLFVFRWHCNHTLGSK